MVCKCTYKYHYNYGGHFFAGMGFIIKKIVVHKKPTDVREGEVHYNMDRTTWDVRNLLEVFSREFTHKDFCLAHLFTDIKFEGRHAFFALKWGAIWWVLYYMNTMDISSVDVVLTFQLRQLPNNPRCLTVLKYYTQK